MKALHKILLGTLLLAGVQFALSGCVADGYAGGYVGEGIYYGGPRYGEPWFHDDTWIDGHRWQRGGPHPGAGVYIHPPRPAPRSHSNSSPRSNRPHH